VEPRRGSVIKPGLTEVLALVPNKVRDRGRFNARNKAIQKFAPFMAQEYRLTLPLKGRISCDPLFLGINAQALQPCRIRGKGK